MGSLAKIGLTSSTGRIYANTTTAGTQTMLRAGSGAMAKIWEMWEIGEIWEDGNTVMSQRVMAPEVKHKI